MHVAMYKSIVILTVSFFVLPSIVFANHGPGTTGGGVSTQSGETIKQGEIIFSLDEAYTNYERVSVRGVEQRAIGSGEFDALGDAFLTNVSMGYGVTDNLQIEGSIGWYSGRNFINAHKESQEDEKQEFKLVDDDHNNAGQEEMEEVQSGVNSAVADPEGLTDLMFRAKYRVMRGQNGHLSIIGGGVFPVGDDGEKLSNGETLEGSSQPGSGRYSALGGIAYSRYLTPEITFDASSLYTYRFQKNDFQIGDRCDTGVAFAYRFTDPVGVYPQLSVFIETLYQYIGKDEDNGIDNINSGGNSLFLALGTKIGFNKNTGVIIAPSIPVIQDLNGEQLETDFKLLSQIFFKF